MKDFLIGVYSVNRGGNVRAGDEALTKAADGCVQEAGSAEPLTLRAAFII